jgi:uncharacterized protein
VRENVDIGQWLGRGMKFPPGIDALGRVAWSEGEQNLHESIQIILQTEPGERLMLPEFGGGLGRFRFEPNTVVTRTLIAQQITRALARWEPRIAVESVEVEADPAESCAATAAIVYRVVSTQSRERVALSVALGH